MLHVRDLVHPYGRPGAGRPVPFTLRVPSLDVPAGGRLLVVGPSGSGKTTLLHILAGLLRPSEGRVTLAGHDLTALDESARDRVRGRHVGLVFQRHHLLGVLTVEENLRLALRLAGQAPDVDRLRATLGRLGLDGLEARRPHQLSLGQRQRVAIARAVLHRPDVLLADEPTASLDDAGAGAVRDLLLAEAEATGAALVVATHDHRIADAFPDALALSADGEAQAPATPAAAR